MTLRRHRRSATLLLALHLGACGPWLSGSWQPSTVSPRQLIEERQPVMIRLTEHDGSQLELVYPAVDGDSISGNPIEGCELGSGCDNVRVKLAIADISAVETWGSPYDDAELVALLEPPEPAEPAEPAGRGEQILLLILFVGVLAYGALDFLCGDADACYGAGF